MVSKKRSPKGLKNNTSTTVSSASSIDSLLSFLSTNAIAFSFLIASVGMVGSLFFQYGLKLHPCEMCWYQRIALYPIVFVAGVGLFNNDKKVWQYILPISIIGLLLALYHNVLQMFPRFIPCTSGTAECAQKQIEIFGFDAIPALSAIAFLTITILMVVKMKRS